MTNEALETALDELIALEAEIEAEVAQRVPEGIATVKALLAENPDLTVGEVASGFLFALPQSHLAWYVAWFFMNAAKEA